MNELKKYCLPATVMQKAFAVLFAVITLPIAVFGDFDGIIARLLFVFFMMLTPALIAIFTVAVPRRKFKKLISKFKAEKTFDLLMSDLHEGERFFNDRFIVGQRFFLAKEMALIIPLDSLTCLEISRNHTPNYKSSKKFCYIYITAGGKEICSYDSMYIDEKLIEEWEKLCGEIDKGHPAVKLVNNLVDKENVTMQ